MAEHFGASEFDTLRGAASEYLIGIRCEQAPQPVPSNFEDGRDDPSCQAMPPIFNIDVGSLVICEDEPSIPSLNEEWKWEREEEQKRMLLAPMFATDSKLRSDQRPQSSSAPIRPDQQGADSEMCYSPHGRMGQTSTMASPSRRKNSSSSPRSRPAHVRNPHALSSDARSHQTQQTHRSDRNAASTANWRAPSPHPEYLKSPRTKYSVWIADKVESQRGMSFIGMIRASVKLADRMDTQRNVIARITHQLYVRNLDDVDVITCGIKMAEREIILGSILEEECKLQECGHEQSDYEQSIEEYAPHVSRNRYDKNEAFGKGWLLYLDWSRTRKVAAYKHMRAQYEDLARFEESTSNLKHDQVQVLGGMSKENYSQRRTTALKSDMSALLRQIQGLVAQIAETRAERKTLCHHNN